jgi:hypothetical protein
MEISILIPEIFQIVESYKTKDSSYFKYSFEELETLIEGPQIETPLNVYMGEHDGKTIKVYQLI